MGGTMTDALFDVLQLPIQAIPYELGKRLVAAHPGRAVVEVGSWAFDLQKFAAAGGCKMTTRPGVHAQQNVGWEGPGKPLTLSIRNAWHEIEWEGRRLDVVEVVYPKGYDEDGHNFVIASDEAEAKRFLSAVCEVGSKVEEAVLVFQSGCFSHSRELWTAIQAASFDDVVLPRALATAIQDDFRHFVSSRELYEKHRVPWKRGALLIGPPGNGKTLCVKAIVKQLGLPCLYVTSFKAQYSPETRGIEQVFARARRTAPCVLVLEDLDSLVSPGSLSFFLNALDGFAENPGIVTIATTNHPERLDPAILERPSRFDVKYRFELPGLEERVRYASLWSARLDPSDRLTEAQTATIAESTEGYSYAFLKELFVSSLVRCMAARRSRPLFEHLAEQAIALRGQLGWEPPPARVADDGDDAEG